MEKAAAEFEQSAKQLGARIVEFSLEPPAFGQIRVAIEMRKLRHPISRARRLAAHDLETRKKPRSHRRA
jgi:hypothetical protein